MNTVIEIIKQQQKGKEHKPEYTVGLQLLDMLNSDSRIEKILEEDLQNESMSLAMCATAIKKEADEINKKSKGNTVCITPVMAEKIIRKFYGLPDPEGMQTEEPAQEPTGIIELEDLL